jgi:hypothetical protein
MTLPMRSALLLSAAVAIAIPGAARGETPPPAVTVTGEATVSAAPDTATIDGGVATEAKTAKEAAEANNKAMGAVLLALKASGIAEKDMQTSRLSLSPQSAPNRTNGGPLQITGYRASNHVVVTLHDVSKAVAVIDTLVGAGANEIGGIAFSVSQASKLLDDARGQAIADAHRKAELLAKAAGITLGTPLSITEETAPGPIPYQRRLSAPMAAAAPVAIGEETLRVVVTVAYGIKQP